MREVADGVEFEFLDAADEASYGRLADSDVYVGGCYKRAFEAGRNLDYIHIFSAGIDRCVSIPGIQSAGYIVTNSAKAASETIAEHAIAMMLVLTRKLHTFHSAQLNSKWARRSSDGPPATAVKGKTMMVLGLGGIGTQAASRAHKLGMRVIATRKNERTMLSGVGQEKPIELWKGQSILVPEIK